MLILVKLDGLGLISGSSMQVILLLTPVRQPNRRLATRGA